MAVVAVVAAWLSILVYAERLRGLSRSHMARSAEVRVEAFRTRPGVPNRPTPLSDWHQKMARKYHDDADLVESLSLTMPVALILLAAAAVLRGKRAKSVVTRAD